MKLDRDKNKTKHPNRDKTHRKIKLIKTDLIKLFSRIKTSASTLMSNLKIKDRCSNAKDIIRSIVLWTIAALVVVNLGYCSIKAYRHEDLVEKSSGVYSNNPNRNRVGIGAEKELNNSNNPKPSKQLNPDDITTVPYQKNFTSCDKKCLLEKANRLKELEEKFNGQKDFFESPSYHEEDVRRDFIDNLFIILGWNVLGDDYSLNEAEVDPETILLLGYTRLGA